MTTGRRDVAEPVGARGDHDDRRPSTTIAAGTAQRGASRNSTSQTTRIGSASIGSVADRLDRREADREQDAGQHRARDRLRDARHGAGEPRPEPGQQDQHAADEERPDRARELARSPARRSAAPHRASTRRMRSGCGSQSAATMPVIALGHAQREQAGRGLRGRRADRLQARDDERERTREPRDRRDDPGGDGLERASMVASLGRRRPPRIRLPVLGAHPHRQLVDRRRPRDDPAAVDGLAGERVAPVPGGR